MLTYDILPKRVDFGRNVRERLHGAGVQFVQLFHPRQHFVQAFDQGLLFFGPDFQPRQMGYFLQGFVINFHQ